MFQFCSLYSGSSGNCSFVQTDTTKLLIDAGQSSKKIEEALASLNIKANSIDGILITHEHSDHTKGLGILSKKFDIPVYANIETWNSMEKQKEKVSIDNIRYFDFNSFFIGDLNIKPFSIPHDAANPCGFNICHGNKKISIATDIGHIEKSVLDNLCDSSFLLLEANYEAEILKYSKYPYLLKSRISGPNGHLSNEEAGKVLSYLTNKGLHAAMLGHLSNENNFPELAYKTVVEQFIKNNISSDNIKLSVAKRFEPSPIINIS